MVVWEWLFCQSPWFHPSYKTIWLERVKILSFLLRALTLCPFRLGNLESGHIYYRWFFLWCCMKVYNDLGEPGCPFLLGIVACNKSVCLKSAGFQGYPWRSLNDQIVSCFRFFKHWSSIRRYITHKYDIPVSIKEARWKKNNNIDSVQTSDHEVLDPKSEVGFKGADWGSRFVYITLVSWIKRVSNLGNFMSRNNLLAFFWAVRAILLYICLVFAAQKHLVPR